MRGIIEKNTRQGKIVSQILSLIFYLNNQQIRYSFEYKGYIMRLSRYNFLLKQYEDKLETNVTEHSYSYVNDRLAEMLKILQEEYDSYVDKI